MDLRDYLRILERRKWIVLLISLAVFGASMGLIQQQPVRHQASALLIIGEQNIIFTGRVGLAGIVYSKGAHAELIKTNNVMRQAILSDELKPYYPNAASSPQAMTGAINALRSEFRVTSNDSISQLTISSTQEDRKRATDVVNAVAAIYESFAAQQQKHHIQNTISFIDKRTETLEKEIKSRAAGLDELPPPAELPYSLEEKALRDRIQGLRTQRADNERRIAKLDGEISYLNNVAAGRTEPPAPGTFNQMSNRIWASILSKEQELKLMLVDHTPAWPPAVKLVRVIRELRITYAQALESEAKDRQTASINAVIEAILDRVGERRTLLNQQDELVTALTKAKEDWQNHVMGKLPPEQQEQRQNELRRQELSDDITDLRAQIALLKNDKNELLVNQQLVSSAMSVNPASGTLPITPDTGRSIPLLILVALLVGLAAAWLMEFLTTTIRTEYDVRRYVNLPLLGAVLKIHNEDERLLVKVAPQSPLAEVFHTISALLEGQAAEKGSKSFMIASSNPEEGKSTVMANLGVALARGGAKVVLIDADLRKAVLHRFFEINNETGLTTYLQSGEPASIDDLTCATSIDNLWLLPAGPHERSPVTMLKSERMTDLLVQLRDKYDYILVDVPPVRIAADTLLLASRMDGVIMLVSAGETSKDDVTHTKRLLEAARGKLVGAVLNKMTIHTRGYYYYYQYYDYGYRYYRSTE